MTDSKRAMLPHSISVGARRLRGLAMLTLACGVCAGWLGRAPAADSAATEERARAELHRLIKRFDFDERPLGNYYDTPMHWARLAGPGLPKYSEAVFDDEVGHAAAPSFRFDLRGGNVAYEYTHSDIPVVSECDYEVVAWVRAQSLEYAGAMVTAYLVNRYGEELPGTYAVSEVADTRRAARLKAEGAVTDDWQKITLTVSGDHPAAHALRLQLWVLQDHVWSDPDPGDLDPIIRQDVDAHVWFDDVSVYRLPRVRVRLSDAAGLVRPGNEETLLLEVFNTTHEDVNAITRIRGSEGTERFRDSAVVRARQTAVLRMPVPELPPDLYTAEVEVLVGRSLLLTRTLRFAVLADLPTQAAMRSDLGVDLGTWRSGDAEAAHELIANLHCGAAKIGVPIERDLTTENQRDYFVQIRDLVHQLIVSRVSTAAVMMPPGNPEDRRQPIRSTRALLEEDPRWGRRLDPIMTLFGGLLSSWQLGAERLELADPLGWTPEAIADVRAKLSRLVAMPNIVVPVSLLDAESVLTGGDLANRSSYASARQVRSIWIPAHVPARAFPQQLAFLVEDDDSSEASLQVLESGYSDDVWLRLEPDTNDKLSRREQVTDLARRVILAKALGPDRLYVPAPFRQSVGSGQVVWEPTYEYGPLRTLFHYLSGKRAVSVMLLDYGGIAIIFNSPDASCVALWTWQEEEPTPPVELYFGVDPVAVDLWGRRVPLEVHGARASLPLTTTPVIVTTVYSPLAMLQASFRIEPNYFQLHEPEHRPVLSMRNHFRGDLTGTIELTPPTGWEVHPASIGFVLSPGEVLERPLDLWIPPRQVASQQNFKVHIALITPEEMELDLDVPFAIGLRDIKVEVNVRWVGSDLLVEHSLRNLSEKAVSFRGFCQAPARARQETEFLEVSGGEQAVQSYVFSNSRDLAGGVLSVRIREIGGERSLDQLVEIPK